MQGLLTINGRDAYTTWGITPSDGALSALLAPPPLKEVVSAASPLEHGGRTLSDAALIRVDERELLLPLNLTARTRDEFFTRYAALCDELARGFIDIRTSHRPAVVYHCLYISCSTFTEFMQGMASIVLKLREPNPMNRK